MSNLALYIDVVNKTLVTGTLVNGVFAFSQVPAQLPAFTQGDQIPIDLYFVTPTGNVFSPYAFKNYTNPTIRFGIGKIGAPTGGTFKITDGAQTTAAIAYNADAATVQAAIRAALTTNWSAAVVTGNAGGPWLIDRGATGNVAQLTASGSALTPDSTVIVKTWRDGTGSLNEIQQVELTQLAGAYQATWGALGSAGTVTPSTIQNGDPSATAPKNEIQRITFSAAPVGGTFKLTFTEGTTAAIAYNAGVTDIADAINNVIGANAISIQNYVGGTSFDIKWADNANHAQATVDASALSWAIGFTATVSLDTLGIDQMLGTSAKVDDALLEIELTPNGGTPETLIHQSATVVNDLLSNGIYGSTPNPNPLQIKRASAQFDKSDLTLANVPGLSANLIAGRTYSFRAVLDLYLDASGGLNVGFGGTATASDFFARFEPQSGTFSLVTATSGTYSTDGTDTAWSMVIEGGFVANGSGTFTIKFAQSALFGTSSVLVGSTLEVREAI